MPKLTSTYIVLKALHEIGWVHRVVSSGNILVDGDSVKLVDLEYAKKIGKTTGGHHEIRTVRHIYSLFFAAILISY